MRVALSWAVCALFCASAAWGSSHRDAGHQAALVLRSSEPLPPIVLQHARKELRRVTEAVPLAVSWYVQPPEGSVAGRLVVVRLHGACSGAYIRDRAGSGPLATTRSQDGRIQPFVDVYCDRISAAIALQVRQYQPLMRQLYFARAFARVLAHELYHVLEGTHHHTQGGLTKARLSGEELVAKAVDYQLVFGEPETERVAGRRGGGTGAGVAGR